MLRPDYKDALKLLKEERAALLAGQLAKVSALSDRKDEIIRDLDLMRMSVVDAQRLKTSAAENARLFQAAIEGLRDAQHRLAELREVRQGLSIYTAAGNRETVRPAGGGMEHKA